MPKDPGSNPDITHCPSIIGAIRETPNPNESDLLAPDHHSVQGTIYFHSLPLNYQLGIDSGTLKTIYRPCLPLLCLQKQ